MPKKSKSNVTSLGRSLVKERFAGRQQTLGNKASSQHYREYSKVADTTDLTLKSVTELNSLDEFLETAELAGTEFTAERMNIEYVHPESQGLTSADQDTMIRKTQNEFKNELRIPRRPTWNEDTSTADLNENERESFLNWRRNLSKLQEHEHITLTPYEKNLEFWRQLWRVIERSDLVVQIVDARDPLLYRCEDLETYVKELSPTKMNMILINKADLLSSKQRQCWAEYFTRRKVTVAFWSAALEMETQEEDEMESVSNSIEQKNIEVDNSERLLTKDELIGFFKAQVGYNIDHSFTIGMVGYPNVGKSSTINAILQSKKVAVSATPGRTKHFQTFHIQDNVVLCDCPGLVFPSFVTNKAEMILSGILSIDEMRDHVSPVNLLCQRIPRKLLEATYGINIVKPMEGEEEDRPPTSGELLDAYGSMRGFMTSHGQPDNPRSARIILKDYVKGKLLYCTVPPGGDQREYSSWNESIIQSVLQSIESRETLDSIPEGTDKEYEAAQQRIERTNRQTEVHVKNEIDDAFFKSENVKSFTKGLLLGNESSRTPGLQGDSESAKPWKRHNNKHKKEKMRRKRNQV